MMSEQRDRYAIEKEVENWNMGEPEPVEIIFAWRDWALPFRLGTTDHNGNTEIAIHVLCVIISVIPALFWEKPNEDNR